MTERKFRVEVVARERTVYLLDAADAQEAEWLAIRRWQHGDSSDLVGLDSSQLEQTHVAEAGDETRRLQDEELVLRFIRERERLLARLGGNLLTASRSDAISAAQAASDLGWLQATRGDEPQQSDAVRAAAALERLCARNALVSFERERIRAGERGTIRLYCTAEYLEKLSKTLYESNPDPGT